MTSVLSWGRLQRPMQDILALHDRRQSIEWAAGKKYLPYGNGRSYGDSCLNEGGILLHTRRLDRFIHFDPATGILSCESGTLLSEIIDLVLPSGWFPPVVPGTRFVTVGGAVANDVHGKNHHRAGTFGRHVVEFELARSDGSVIRCTPQRNSALFDATIGGLGLTGLIRWVTLQLRRCAGPAIVGESVKFSNLDEFFLRSAESDRDWEYTVAWIDCLAQGDAKGRGLLMRGNHAPALAAGRAQASRRSFHLRFDPPLSLINSVSLAAFNCFYYRRQFDAILPKLWHYESFFFPLDSMLEWNRIYGPRGFFQYQCVIPPANARDGLAAMLSRIANSGQGSFLAVLKEFGPLSSPGLLSFPRPGATLALDFPNRGESTRALLDELDGITLEAGGAVYPAKDARMSAAAFARFYSRLDEFSAFVDPAFSSSFWRRVFPA